jgi:tRNA (cytidine/uridine-2'-O-)-methyltransferase
MDQRQVRRAGLDYWKHVDLVEHEDGDAFWAWAEGRRIHLYSSHGTATYATATHQPGDVLVFGRESVGLPKDIIAKHGALTIPMDGPTRSLNLSNAVAIVVYNALQTVAPSLF